jgi:hypothetical protein
LLRRSAALIAVASLALAAGAFAGNGDRQQVHLVRADQASARTIVLKESDLGSGPWKGGAKKPDLSAGPTCKNYHPKASDLVLTGVAETDFSATDAIRAVDTEVQILKTRHMVALDWQRAVLAPGLPSCLKSYLTRTVPAGSKLVSMKKIAFPHIAPYTAAYRILLDISASGKTIRVFVDAVFLGRGRTEITMTTFAPDLVAQLVFMREIAWARAIVARIPA